MPMPMRVLALTLVLAACDGGGGGSPIPPDDTTPPPGDTESFYPLAQGDTWYYGWTSSEAFGTALIRVQVEGSRNVAGRETAVLAQVDLGSGESAAESYAVKDARAYTVLGNNDPDDFLTPKLVPYDEMRFPVALKSFTALDKNGADLGLDIDGDGHNELFDANAQVAVEAFEPLATAAGSYSRTARVRSVISGTLRLSSGQSLPIAATTTEWRAPGVGLVRQAAEITLLGRTQTSLLEARGHRVGGVTRGLFGPFTLSANLAPADSDSTTPGRPAVASDGSRFLIVTRRQTGVDVTSPMMQWVAHLVADDGTVRPAVELNKSAVGLWFQGAVGFDGNNYLAVFESQGLRAQRVTGDGSPLDGPDGLVVRPFGGRSPAVAFSGDSYLVVYSAGQDLYGVLVSPSGQVGSEFTIQSGPGDQAYPAVAFDGTNFVVVWEDHGDLTHDGARDVYGRRISPQGALLDAEPIPISTAAEAQSSPALACDGTNCLVIWVDRRQYPGQPYNVSPGPGDIYGTRLDKSGQTLDGSGAAGGLPIATGITANAGYPALAWTGGEYLAAWSAGAYANNPGGPTGIFGARVSPGGSVASGVAGFGMVLSGAPRDATRLYYPTLAAGAGSALAVWLDNTERFGTTKSVRGTVIHPPVRQ